MSTESKPSIVFAHGRWADGSCFNKVMGPLRAEGYEVIASEHGLDSHAGDVDCVLRSLGRVSSPAILVGYSYGGSLITACSSTSRLRTGASGCFGPGSTVSREI
jgi:pimeloyl-ACP methyl ester carboxylesterase